MGGEGRIKITSTKYLDINKATKQNSGERVHDEQAKSHDQEV